VEVAARPATPDDVATIDGLADEAIVEQVDGRGGAIWAVREAVRQPRGEGLAAAIADPEQLVLVGTIDDTVVGYATAEREVLADGSTLGVLTAVFVLPDGRAISVGEVLLDAVIEWCRSHGCVGLDAYALPGNRDTKNFFETFGLTARLIVVHKRLT
jgi:GNAT superfamily N-acetyltransferase